jgi:hypothetical protein
MLRSAPQTLSSPSTMLHLCFKTTVLFGGRCGNRASPEMLFPDMSGTTSTDEEEAIDVSVGVVSSCDRGKLPCQYYRNGYGYFMKNILSSLDPPGSVLPCPSTSISWSSIRDHHQKKTGCTQVFRVEFEYYVPDLIREGPTTRVFKEPVDVNNPVYVRRLDPSVLDTSD